MNSISATMTETLALMRTWDIHQQALSSLFLLVAFLLFRWGGVLSIRRWSAPTGEEKRRWIIQVKNISLIMEQDRRD